MRPDQWEKCKEKMGILNQYFQEMESGFSVVQDLDFDRDRGASFRFDPKGGGRSLLLRLALEILEDYEIAEIIRLMEKRGWQSLLTKIPESKCLRFTESGRVLIPSFCNVGRPA